jgi:hypothetical protein
MKIMPTRSTRVDCATGSALFRRRFMVQYHIGEKAVNNTIFVLKCGKKTANGGTGRNSPSRKFAFAGAENLETAAFVFVFSALP